MGNHAPEITQLIDSVRRGEDGASASLLEAVYGELYALAGRQFSDDRAGHTLQTTALVNEAFLRLFGSNSNPDWQNRAHFFGAAAEAMRRILVDHARKKQTLKRGSGKQREGFFEDNIPQPVLSEVIEVNEALDEFAKRYPDKAEVVKYRYFAGLSIAQAAEALQISVPTANRYWAFARAWLFDHMRNE
ncbi:MAG: sigma-70 family RNA polymerase sigma factor [Planctomycetota bacterium]